MKLELISKPSALPITLESIKNYIKVLDDLQDSEIELIAGANLIRAEDITNLTLLGLTTYKWTLFNNFPLTTSMPKSPLESITKIEYLDDNGEMQLLTEDKYNADNTTIPGTLVFLQVPPTTKVEITFVAGFFNLPKEVELWLKVIVLEDFDHLPDAEKSKHIDRMLDSLRIIPI
jgi:uncharacterized phiE125 gp8 family phage protein